MNIKSLRKSYENLTMLERLSLIDNAESRDDENEIRAIVAASPRETFSQCDFADLKREITTLRLCNLIVRLGYVMKFDFFLDLAEQIELTKKPNNQRIERLVKDARLSAYLYIRATDSWKLVNDELGLRSDFDEDISKHLFAMEILKDKEEYMRDMAFTEDDARDYVNERGNCSGKIQTMKDEAKEIREALGL